MKPALPVTAVARSAASLVVLLFSSSHAFSETRPEMFAEYTKACERLQSTISSVDYLRSTSPEEQHKMLEQHFFEGISSLDVKESFESIMRIDPDKRYQVMQEQIFESTGMLWVCPAFEEIQNL